jgi:uncharacterized protein (TIGR02646 family)
VIYVPKPAKQVPPKFLKAARAEMDEALPLFARASKKPPKYEFKAYQNPELRKALDRLFKEKCAYCEATNNLTSPMQVEHYRPKSVYYWLAADWSNLLPSCGHCNNGKRAKFPLRDPRKQAKRKGQEKREDPLLLNPSDPRRSRRPDRHLTFNAKDGTVQAVTLRGAPSPIGEASITVYNLTHAGLSKARSEWATRVNWQIENMRRAQRGSAADREFAYEGLKSFLGPEQPFRALTIKILRESGFVAPRTKSGNRRT